MSLKGRGLNNPKGCTGKYTKGAKQPLQKKIQKEAKSLTTPQSYNLTKRTNFLEAKGLGFTTKLAQEKRENTKALFSLIRENSTFSNTNLFLSFPIAQNK